MLICICHNVLIHIANIRLVFNLYVKEKIKRIGLLFFKSIHKVIHTFFIPVFYVFTFIFIFRDIKESDKKWNIDFVYFYHILSIIAATFFLRIDKPATFYRVKIGKIGNICMQLEKVFSFDAIDTIKIFILYIINFDYFFSIFVDRFCVDNNIGI